MVAVKDDNPQPEDEHGGLDDPCFDDLTPQQEKAILALLEQPTIARAAETAGIGQRTLYRWLKDDSFSRAFRTARREAFAQAISLTHRYAPMAVNTLVKIMADTAVAAQSRVSAANAVLKYSRESLELDDLAARVEALEQAQGQRH